MGATRARRIVRAALILLLLLASVLTLWALWWEPRRLVTRELSMLPSCWTGPPVRIAVASDLHVGAPGVDLKKLDTLVADVNSARPDVVVLLGDYVIQGVKGGRFVTPEMIAQHLGALKAPLGVYAVLGNHDWWLDAPRVERALSSAGIRVLEDRSVSLDRPGDGFWLMGISDFWEGRHDVAAALADVRDGRPIIAITHNPDVFPAVPERVCLTLAGHTHGGQVALPLIGRPIVPSRYGQRYAWGSVREGNRELFVTSGVGTSILPVRFRVPPEVVLLNVGDRR
jgi:uncharacterized protein